jgi:hypothetical protein
MSERGGHENGPGTQIGRIEGRLIALERQVGEIHADVKALVRRNAEREGAETAVEKSDLAATQSRNRRAALFAGAVGGGVTLALQVTARKLGLIQ